MRNHITAGFCLLALVFVTQCAFNEGNKTITQLIESTTQETGKQEYLDSPYVTAGDRLYMVGHQNGSFPDLGWHVEGEMGGIWNHPIKLMDGFSISINNENGDEIQCLNNASEFINYPVGNQHVFQRNDSYTINRTQFVPDGIEGMIIELDITNNTTKSRELKVGFTGMVDLMPVWLSDSLDIVDGADSLSWNEEQQVYIAKDQNNPWFTIFGSSAAVDTTYTGQVHCSINRKGNGLDATIESLINLEPQQSKSIRYFIAGSHQMEETAWQQYEQLMTNPAGLLEKKIARYQTIKEQSSLSIPEKEIENMYRWMKYNTDWLIRDVDGIGRGVSAGIPDYPWWFAADNAYTLQGLLATGRFEEVYSTIDLLYQLSEKVNGNGRVIHEASTNEVVFNKGNMNETPHIIWLLWNIYEWTGDKNLLETYYPQVRRGLEFLLTISDEDGNGYPNGHGMMEIRGLDTEMIDVAVYTQQAFDAAAKIAEQLGYQEEQKEYADRAASLKDRINTEWWVEDFNSYADFRATRSQTLNLIEDAIVRADTLGKPWAVRELQNARETIRSNESEGVEGYVVHHNWVVNTPMEMAMADTAKAQQALATARDYTSRFGMYVTGIDRDENREESNKWEVFSYVGAVMTLPTGVQAIAEANYGNIAHSYEYMQMLSNSFGYALPGSMYEVSPDYGMIVQAWNIYAVAVPVVKHYFGIQPSAYKEEVTIRPQMPDSWDNASIKNVRIGDNSLSINKQTEGEIVSYSIKQKNEDWKVRMLLPQKVGYTTLLNGSRVDPEPGNSLFELVFQGRSNTITIQPASN